MTTEPKSEWTVDELGLPQIYGHECRIYIDTRPSYCDRGNYLANIRDVWGAMVWSFDWQDGWPRYYFDLDRAKLEVEAWLKKRGQWV